MKMGADVSYSQGVIDWDLLKKCIDFAIIKCGYGDDTESQDDIRWARNVAEAERTGIPYGVYIYSFADSEERLQSEIAHTLRLINGHAPFCVYLYLEGGLFKLGRERLTEYALRWCRAIESAGYKAGVYASESWFNNYVDINAVYNAGYSVWVARYGPQPKWDGVKYDLWQFTSGGNLMGVNGSINLNRLCSRGLLAGAPRDKKDTEAKPDTKDRGISRFFKKR